MKKKVLVSLMLSMVLAFSLTACGKDGASDNVKDTDKQQVSEKEDEGGLFDKLSEKKKKGGYRENYYQVNAEFNNENPEKNKFSFATPTEILTVTGFRDVGDFYGGVAMAETLDGDLVLIDIKGKELTKAGEYSWMRRVDDGKDYIEAVDAETDLHGVIDKTGKIIVPCEYDDIEFTYGSSLTDFAFKAVKDGLMAVYTLEGKKVADNLNADNYEAYYYAGPIGEYGIIYVFDYISDDGDYRVISEKTGELVLPEGIVFSEIYASERNGKIYDPTTEKARLVLLSEDLTEVIELDKGTEYARARVTLVDNQWLIDDDNVHILIDEKGKPVFDFGMFTYVSQDEKGNTIFISKGEGKCVIRDKNFKEISTIENVEYGYNIGYGYFCGYSIVDGNVSRERNVYDLKGKLIYENIASAWDSCGSYYDMSGEVVEDKCIVIEMQDGSQFLKTLEMKEFLPLTGEWTGYYMGYPTFETDEEIIICDKDFKEIGRISSEAGREYTFGIYIERLEGMRKYYGCKGDLLYEKEE